MSLRVAVAATDKSQQVADYLPKNYRVLGVTTDQVDIFPAGSTLICGVDDHGWTLDDYVIPRLGSGWIACREIIHNEGEAWGVVT